MIRTLIVHVLPGANRIYTLADITVLAMGLPLRTHPNLTRQRLLSPGKPRTVHVLDGDKDIVPNLDTGRGGLTQRARRPQRGSVFLGVPGCSSRLWLSYGLVHPVASLDDDFAPLGDLSDLCVSHQFPAIACLQVCLAPRMLPT